MPASWPCHRIPIRLAVAELSRLKTRVKHAPAKKQLDKSLDTVASPHGPVGLRARRKFPLPTCGLTTVGERIRAVRRRERLSQHRRATASRTCIGTLQARNRRQVFPPSVKECACRRHQGAEAGGEGSGQVLASAARSIGEAFLPAGLMVSRRLSIPLPGSSARRHARTPVHLAIHKLRANQVDAIWSQGCLVGSDNQSIASLNEQTSGGLCGTRFRVRCRGGSRVEKLARKLTKFVSPFKQ